MNVIEISKFDIENLPEKFSVRIRLECEFAEMES